MEITLGPQASDLSAATVSRLKQLWAQEYRQWCDRRVDKDRWVYLWVDGIYSGLRAESARLCALVVIGVNERGLKQFLAIGDCCGSMKTDTFLSYIHLRFEFHQAWYNPVSNAVDRCQSQ